MKSITNFIQKVSAKTLLVVGGLAAFGCYGSVVDSFEYFDVQMIAQFDANWTNKTAPDVTVDKTVLTDYEEFEDNIEKLHGATPLQFSWWLEDVRNGNSGIDPQEIVYSYAKFRIGFDTDKSDGWDTPDTWYDLAEFQNVLVGDYYENPQIHFVPGEVAEIISEAILNEDYGYTFWTESEFGAPTAPTGVSDFFPSIRGVAELAVELEVKP